MTQSKASQLCTELAVLWPSDRLSSVFLSDNGSAAIEVALKMAERLWLLAVKPERSRFVTFQRAYHGDTKIASALSVVPFFTNDSRDGSSQSNASRTLIRFATCAPPELQPR